MTDMPHTIHTTQKVRPKRVIRCFSALLIALFVCAASAAHADIYWECEQVVYGKGWPTRKKVIRNYFTMEKIREDIGENVIIADFKTMIGYVLNMTDKRFLQMQMGKVGKIPEALKTEEEVTPTRSYARIAGYKCRKYKIKYMEREYEQWLSKEVAAYKELKEIDRALGGLIRQNPLFKMGIVGKMDQLDGFPVRTVMRFEDGRTKTVTLKRVSQKQLSDTVFQVPEGYQLPR